MIHDLNALNVGTEPWSPGIHIPKPEPMEEQKAHPWCIVLLRGMQTRFYRDDEEFRKGIQMVSANARTHHFDVYCYSEETKRYVKMLDGDKPFAGIL